VVIIVQLYNNQAIVVPHKVSTVLYIKQLNIVCLAKGSNRGPHNFVTVKDTDEMISLTADIDKRGEVS